MRNRNASFWREAARSLPDHVAARYIGYFEAAETWELVYDGIVALGARIKGRIARTLHPQAA